MFEKVPENWWWDAAANLTAWLHWPAISAILSGAALLMTIQIATRSDRAARDKDAVFLIGVANLIEEVHVHIDDAPDETDLEETVEFYRDCLEVWNDGQIFAQLIDIKMRDFPSVATFHMFSAARSTSQLLRMQLEAAVKVKERVADLPDHTLELADIIAQLEREAAKRERFTISHSIFATWVQRSWEKAFNRSS